MIKRKIKLEYYCDCIECRENSDNALKAWFEGDNENALRERAYKAGWLDVKNYAGKTIGHINKSHFSNGKIKEKLDSIGEVLNSWDVLSIQAKKIGK